MKIKWIWTNSRKKIEAMNLLIERWTVENGGICNKREKKHTNRKEIYSPVFGFGFGFGGYMLVC